MTTTDTPRTDAEWASTWQTERRLHELCQQLERELAASKAEVERLLRERNLEHDACNNYLHILDDRKAEVERLRGQLKQAVEIAEVFESELDEYHSVDRNCPDAAWHYPYGWERSEEAKNKLEALNKEIK